MFSQQLPPCFFLSTISDELYQMAVCLSYAIEVNDCSVVSLAYDIIYYIVAFIMTHVGMEYW